MIQVGDTLPAAVLMEFVDVAGEGCSLGPNPVDVTKASAGKAIAVFGLPGAFTPTCSAKHVPGYLEQHDALKAAGVADYDSGPLITAGLRLLKDPDLPSRN